MVRKRTRTKRRPRKAASGGELLRTILGKDRSDRRIVILRALWRLILQKGYASTSLSDVARKARISPSHLVYYFPSKESILLELYRTLFGALLAGITTHRDEAPAAQFERLSSYAFLEPVMPLADRSIVLELIGLAVHNPRLRRSTSDYAQQMVGYLQELFARTPRAFDLSAEDAALVAASTWSGLLTNSYYYKRFDRTRAASLFLDVLLILAGLREQSTKPRDGRSAPVMQVTGEGKFNAVCDEVGPGD